MNINELFRNCISKKWSDLSIETPDNFSLRCVCQDSDGRVHALYIPSRLWPLTPKYHTNEGGSGCWETGNDNVYWNYLGTLPLASDFDTNVCTSYTLSCSLRPANFSRPDAFKDLNEHI